MKKSKHFRKDVIIARVIAAVLVIVLIAIICLTVSLLSKPSGSDKDTQNTQNTQMENPNNQPSGSEETPDVSIEPETEGPQATEEEPIVDSEEDGQVYVKTTTQVKLRKEPNTNCATLDRIDGGTELLVLETLEGWYKVSHNGQEGYVSADYAQIVEAE